MFRNFYRTHGLGILMWLLFASDVSAEKLPATPVLFTLKEAVEVALSHHPSLFSARGASSAQEARLGEARADFLPQVDVTSAYSRATANFAPSSQFGSLNRSAASGRSNTSFDNYSAALSLRQRLYDFGKTGAQTKTAAERLGAIRFDAEASRLNIVTNVKVAYWSLLEAQHLAEVREDAVKQFEEHLRQVQGFHLAGTRTRFDVTKAEVDLSNARLDLIKARNAEEVARVTLANALGAPDQPIGPLEDQSDFKPLDISEEQAVSEALNHRPELLSLSAQRRAAEASVRSALADHFPVLSGTADYTYRGQDFPLVWNWDVGLTLTLPIFSGFLTRSQVAEARANVLVSDANEEALRQNILLEVHQALSNLKEAEERVQTSDVVVRQAEESLALANGRFQAGLGTSVERTDAQVQLANAKTAQIQAIYDYRVAEAQLQKAMGRRESSGFQRGRKE